MKPESVVFAIAGACFGLIVGWVLGSQQNGPRASAPAAQSREAATETAASQAGGTTRPAVLDQSKVQALKNIVDGDPKNATARVQLANVYFDAEKYEDATHWYQEALKLDPKDVNVSTDLGVSYYYQNQPDRALEQFAHSLALDPKHAKTMLNRGIVRAFGKRDLEGAAKDWQKVVELAPPDSPEAQAAKRALDSLKSAHPDVAGGQPK